MKRQGRAAKVPGGAKAKTAEKPKPAQEAPKKAAAELSPEDTIIQHARGPGRPPLEIDAKQVLKLASMHCTMEEIGAVVGCSVDTLERNFADIIKAGKAVGKMSLRRRMWTMAESGNTAMAIWLSKQILGMREKQELVHELPPIRLSYSLDEPIDVEATPVPPTPAIEVK